MHRRALSSTGYRRSTYYKTLGIPHDATRDQIKTAFLTLRKSHHPDIPDHKEKPQFHEITEAYNILRDPISRRAYDNTLPTSQPVAKSSLHAHHLADTAARFRRASARPNSSSSPFASSRAPPNTYPPFPRRSPANYPLPGAHDKHNHHPGQRFRPPDPVAQTAAWAAQQRTLRERKTRGTKLMASTMAGFSFLLACAWFLL
ncbi:DnaJ domain-containing protein [Mycena rebaudengoi]|nr:DnaJ domain-containing protein [Mycena rebaudengoi]